MSQTVSKGTGPTQSLTVNTSTNRVSGWSYDAAGNTTNDGSRTYTYDANNRITQVGSAEYRYDGEGNRVMKVAGSETIRYVMGLGEHSSATGRRALYVYLGSEKLVEYRYANATRFYHNDHLGTAKAVTDHTGLVPERWDHYPFGKEWVSGLSGDRYRYTGHLRDQETGNDYAGARFYANVRGRWLSVDPVLGDVSNPQRLNRYAYLGSDPVNIVDPDGREWRFVRTPHTFRQEWEGWEFSEVWEFTRSGPGPGGGAGAFGEGGRGGGPSLLTQEGSSARFQFIAQSTLHSLVKNIRWDDPDCAEIFSTLGVNKQEYRAKLGSVQLVDGTTSGLLIDDLVNAPYANAAGVSGWTVARLFKENFPDSDRGSRINAWTPPTGPYIFLYGRGFPGSPLKPYSGITPATIAHEVFHKLHHLQDEHLLRGEWGLDPTGSSQQFSDYFRSKCL